MRKIASHQLILPNSQQLRQMVVEIQSGQVVRYYPLQGEQAQTEWLSGSILLKQDTDGLISAFYEGKKIE